LAMLDAIQQHQERKAARWK